MKYKLSFLSLLFPLLLLVSGQVFAASCTSVAAGAAWGTGTTYTAWTNATIDGCNSSAGTADSLPAATKDVIVNSTSAPLTGSASMAAKTLTINTGATFTPGSNTITISGNFTNNGTFNPASSTVAFDSAAVLAGTITFNHLVLSGSGTVALAATNTVGGNVTTYGAALTGTLKFVDAGAAVGRTITTSTAATIPTLDASAVTTATTIAFSGAVSNIIGTLVLPTANAPGGTAKTLVITVPASQTLTITNGIPSGCVATTHAISGNVITGASSGNVTCTITPSISAPIFSTKEKPAVFSQEVK